MLTPREQAVLDGIQAPLSGEDRPFRFLADQLGMGEEQVLETLELLQSQGYLREISAIFDGKKLGYQTTLVAAVTRDPDRAAPYISRHSGVSHNYRRRNRFNLWFTFAAPPRRNLQEEVERLCAPFRPEAVHLLTALKTYKLGVRFGGGLPPDRHAGPVASPGKTAEKVAVDPRVVRALQDPWPLEKEIWPALAEREGLSPEYLKDQAGRYLAAGVIRRISGVVRHRKIGYSHNGMSCFLLPAERLDEAGRILAAYPEVSHCYHRSSYPDWPYNLYAMSHSKSAEEAEEVRRRMIRDLDDPESTTLFSDKEYKKERVRYFLEEETCPLPAACRAGEFSPG